MSALVPKLSLGLMDDSNNSSNSTHHGQPSDHDERPATLLERNGEEGGQEEGAGSRGRNEMREGAGKTAVPSLDMDFSVMSRSSSPTLSLSETESLQSEAYDSQRSAESENAAQQIQHAREKGDRPSANLMASMALPLSGLKQGHAVEGEAVVPSLDLLAVNTTAAETTTAGQEKQQKYSHVNNSGGGRRPSGSSHKRSQSLAASVVSSTAAAASSGADSSMQQQNQGKQVDFLLTKFCFVRKGGAVGDNGDGEKQQKQEEDVREKVQQLVGRDVEFDLVETEGGRTICALKNQNELTMDHVRNLVNQNHILKSKLEKTMQAMTYFEKENVQLRYRLSGCDTARSSSSSGRPLSNRSTSHEVETLRAKLQKHEQLRAEMIRTVDSLKRQHQQLTQAILSNDFNMSNNVAIFQTAAKSSNSSMSAEQLGLNFGSLQRGNSSSSLTQSDSTTTSPLASSALNLDLHALDRNPDQMSDD